MKSEALHEEIPEEVEYPRLMEYSGYAEGHIVIMQTGEKEGFVVWVGPHITSHRVGDYSAEWSIGASDNWRPFRGKITLEN